MDTQVMNRIIKVTLFVLLAIMLSGCEATKPSSYTPSYYEGYVYPYYYSPYYHLYYKYPHAFYYYSRPQPIHRNRPRGNTNQGTRVYNKKR